MRPAGREHMLASHSSQLADFKSLAPGTKVRTDGKPPNGSFVGTRQMWVHSVHQHSREEDDQGNASKEERKQCLHGHLIGEVGGDLDLERVEGVVCDHGVVKTSHHEFGRHCGGSCGGSAAKRTLELE